MNILNEGFTYSSFKEQMQMIIPIDFANVCSNFNFYRNENQYNIYQNAIRIAPIISNITFPYRVNEDGNCLRDYIEQLQSSEIIKIYNVAIEIPIVSQIGDLLKGDIFKYREKSNYLNFFNEKISSNVRN